MPETELKELAANWDPKTQRDRSENADEMEALDESFHMTLAEGSGNLALAHYLSDINRQIRVIRRLDFTDATRVDKTYQEHFQICKALLKRDLGKAQQLMRTHIKRSQDFAKNLTLTQLAKSRFNFAS